MKDSMCFYWLNQAEEALKDSLRTKSKTHRIDRITQAWDFADSALIHAKTKRERHAVDAVICRIGKRESNYMRNHDDT